MCPLRRISRSVYPLSPAPFPGPCPTIGTNQQTNTPQVQIPLIDLTPLELVPKILPPVPSQLPNESLRYWAGVTDAIRARQFGRATVLKTEIEERQRRKAREREEGGVEWSPRFFVGSVTPLGRPELTEDGEEALRRLERGEWEIEESLVTAS